MQVLVTGGSGLLGRAVVRELRAAGHDALGLAFSRQAPHLRTCDITDPAQLGAVLRSGGDCIVHEGWTRSIVEGREQYLE